MITGRRSRSTCGLALDYFGWAGEGGYGSAPSGGATGSATSSTSGGGGGTAPSAVAGSLNYYHGSLAAGGDAFAIPGIGSSPVSRIMRISAANVISSVGPAFTASSKCQSSVTYHEASDSLVWRGGDGDIWMYNIGGGTLSSLPNPGGSPSRFIVGHDGFVWGLSGASTIFSAVKVDPVGGTAVSVPFTLIDGSTFGSGYCFIPHPDGNVYGCGGTMLRINLAAATVDRVGSFSNPVLASRGVAIAPDGKIYIAPSYYADGLMVFDPTTDEVTTIAVPTAAGECGGVVFGCNGNLYFPPYNGTSLVELNPTTLSTHVYYMSISGQDAVDKWLGGVQRDDNTIVFFPYRGTKVAALTMPGATPPTGWNHSPYSLKL